MDILMSIEKVRCALAKRFLKKKQKTYEDWLAKGYRNLPKVSFLSQEIKRRSSKPPFNSYYLILQHVKVQFVLNFLLQRLRHKLSVHLFCYHHAAMPHQSANLMHIHASIQCPNGECMPCSVEQNPQSSHQQTSDDKTQPVWNERFRIILPDAGNATKRGMVRHFSYQAVSRLLPKQGQVTYGKWNCCAPVSIAPICAVLQINEHLHSK